VRRGDPGDPGKCPVWQLHQLYSDDATKQWVVTGCTTAGIGCLECKQPVIDAIVREQQPWRERAETYLANPRQVHRIVETGTERARTVARQTMGDVRAAMGLAVNHCGTLYLAAVRCFGRRAPDNRRARLIRPTSRACCSPASSSTSCASRYGCRSSTSRPPRCAATTAGRSSA
jgi:hypothetical protein